MKPNAETRILVVEDDPFFMRVLIKRLESEGYVVSSAEDGREGMKSIVMFEPHLVISDWMMPHVDGLELCQAVKTGLKEGAPYFMLLTAKGEVDDRLLALENGADDYLVKPCDHGELLARVQAGQRLLTFRERLQAAQEDLLRVRADLHARTRLLERLAGLLPFCPQCLRVRLENGDWEELEDHLLRVPGPAPECCPACAQGTRAAA